MKLSVNTKEVMNAGDKLITLSGEIDDLINELYNSINDLFKYGYWQGISANKYREYISREPEKIKFVNNKIKEYGEVIRLSAINIDALSKKYNRYDKNIY